MRDDTISRQTTIDAIEQHKTAVLGECKWDEGIAYGYAAAHRHLVEIVKQLPSAERREVQSSGCGYWDSESSICSLYRPSAERHGRWVDVEPAPHNLFYATCSVCGDRQTIEVANYCPNCGASTDEVEE